MHLKGVVGRSAYSAVHCRAEPCRLSALHALCGKLLLHSLLPNCKRRQRIVSFVGQSSLSKKAVFSQAQQIFAVQNLDAFHPLVPGYHSNCNNPTADAAPCNC